MASYLAASPGARLGPYEILSALGAGGMGEVYRARDTRLDRAVAIKVLPAHLAADPQFRERFDREARAISQLTHPHICTLHDVGEHDGTAFLVMELLDGETLADRLTKGALPVDQALKTAIEIASALDNAHRAGVVHRDLKPGNIILTKTGAKLLDFGLAKTSVVAQDFSPAVGGRSKDPRYTDSMFQTTPPNLTAHGTILGTFQYMAPEQLEGRDADARTDIFAFGAVVYEMLTGKKAFEGKSQASLIGAIMHGEPAPIAARSPLAPPALDRVVRKCLAKDPAERWQSAKDLHDELRWIAGEGASAAAAPAMTPTTAMSPRVSVVAWVVAVAVLLLATLGLSGALLLRHESPAARVTRLDVATPATSDPFSFALSPDGRQLAFVANGENGLQLWVRSFDEATARALAGTANAQFPFWSPDGRSLGFFADAKLKRLDLVGGAMQVLANAPSARGGSWSPVGTIVFSPTNSSGLMRVAATGGPTMELTHRGGATSHRWPQFLPDGDHILFSSALGPSETRGIYIGSLDGSEPIRVVATESSAAYIPPGFLLQVSPQGVLVGRRFDLLTRSVSGEPIPLAQSVRSNRASGRGAFAASSTGLLAYRSGGPLARQIVWTDRTGKTVAAISGSEDAALGFPELAPDGTRFAVGRTVDANSDVWLGESSRGIVTRLTFDAALDSQPVWSPDGSRVAFRSGRTGHRDNLFENTADGAAEERPLLVDDHDKAPLSWSSEGRFLLYGQNDDTTFTDLWVLPLVADHKPFPFVQTPYDEVHGQFAPDLRWIAYASNETGRYEIYIRPFPGPGGKSQVSTLGGIYPRWRADGGELFFVAPDSAMMAVTIDTPPGAAAPKVGAPLRLFDTRMSVAGNNGIGGYLSAAQYAVARDGRFLMIVNTQDAAASPITIVQNWDAGLKK